jgi:hypothetical protein
VELYQKEKTVFVDFNYIIETKFWIELKSKKGFIITAAVLGAITAGSFAIWFIPQNNQSSIIISNPQDELDALIDQQKAIAESDAIEFDKMQNGQITPENYIAIAEISSSQIRSMIISITEPDVPENWSQSYSALGDALRAYNTYLRETTVIAEKLKADPGADVTEDLQRLGQYLSQTQDSISASNDARPA